MIQSMTAFACARLQTDEDLLVIEIHSVNRKGLDLNINLPKEFLSLDIPVRKKLSQFIHRGHVTLRILRDDLSKGLGVVETSKIERLKVVQQEWFKVARALGYPPYEAISFEFLLSQALQAPSKSMLEGQIKREFEQALTHALDTLCEMKQTEGKILAQDIMERINHIHHHVDHIASLSSDIPKKHIEKLKNRLKQYEILEQDSEERLIRELVVVAEKIDISEEITRLRSHIDQFKGLISGVKKCFGKELDFLVQEMNREVNTIASKSPEIKIIQLALAIKGEQEKIREQLQNIE